MLIYRRHCLSYWVYAWGKAGVSRPWTYWREDAKPLRMEPLTLSCCSTSLMMLILISWFGGNSCELIGFSLLLATSRWLSLALAFAFGFFLNDTRFQCTLASLIPLIRLLASLGMPTVLEKYLLSYKHRFSLRFSWDTKNTLSVLFRVGRRGAGRRMAINTGCPKSSFLYFIRL